MVSRRKLPLGSLILRRLNRSSSSDEKPIVLWDTSAVIELEEDYQTRVAEFLKELHEEGYGNHFPELILREIAKHNELYVRGGRPEISSETTDIIAEVNQLFGVDYCEKEGGLVHECEAKIVDGKHVCDCTVDYCKGGLRYFLDEAMLGIFSGSGKKSIEDPI